MSIETLLTLEVDGLCNTISDYTRDHYILHYTNLLKKCTYPKDKELISLVIDKLIVWYQETYKSIQENNYITNKKQHTKSYELLKEMKALIHKAA